MHRNLLVLVVDNDPERKAFFEHAFHKAAPWNSLHVVDTSDTAIAYLKGKPGSYRDREKYPLPSVLLVNNDAPGNQALRLLGWIRQQPLFRSLVVVLFSASIDRKSVTEAYEKGANSFIKLPAALPQFDKAIQAFCNYWLRDNFPEEFASE